MQWQPLKGSRWWTSDKRLKLGQELEANWSDLDLWVLGKRHHMCGRSYLVQGVFPPKVEKGEKKNIGRDFPRSVNGFLFV